MKGIQYKLLEYIDKEHNTEENFQNINQLLIDQKILENRHDTSTFLYLISKIANNHHRINDFFTKIEHIIKSIKDDILKHFTNTEIFDIFKQNKRLLLFLLQEKIIQLDTKIVSKIIEGKYREFFYPHYFYTEIKPFISCILDADIKRKIPENFDQKRSNGENDQIVCELIRKDSIEEFITFVNKSHLSLKSTIELSIFETNPLLLKKKKVTLIEYTAFYGSIQIFRYLYLNNVELSSSLWIYSIHGANEEIIHILNEQKVEPKFEFIEYNETHHFYSERYVISFEGCLKEALKCHHNEIANYILNNYIDKNELAENIGKFYDRNLSKYCFHYYNFDFFQSDFNSKFIFHYSCQYNYYNIVNFLLNTKRIDINSTVILKLMIFINQIPNKILFFSSNFMFYFSIKFYNLLFENTVLIEFK